MAYAFIALFVVAVLAIAWHSARRGKRAEGCCAPARPEDDARMRAALRDDQAR